ncbi:MAG: toxin TcdB middle/N-terminal domain-containing protein, partial [Deltaproteobacteria bacterium]|nr:toxin TcdB middle/N-terminal domain-containing protein [Deltaproteobacteria bacterium]
DGFPDRLLGGKNSFPDPWKVYLSDGRNGFSAGPIDWANPSGSEGDGSNGDIQTRNNTGVLADLVDLNGDGLPDRVVKDARTAWKVWFNTGKGFESVARPWANPSGDIKGAYEYIRAVGSQSVLADLADINGDGLPDRIVEGASNSDTFRVYLNLGDGFAEVPITWANPSGSQGFKHPRDLSTGGQTLSDFVDLDGDGLLDRLTGTATDDLWGVYRYDGEKPDLLTGILNGTGGVLEIRYQASTRYLDAQGNRASPDLPFPIQTVLEVRRHDGIDTADDMVTTYAYQGGFYDAPSREFRGFSEVSAIEGDSGDPGSTITVTRFYQDDALKGQVDRVEVRDGSGTLLSEVRNYFLLPPNPDHAVVSAASGGAAHIALVKRAEATLYGATAQATTAVSFRYDALGNVLEKIEEGEVPPGGAPDGDERKTCVTYAPSGPAYRGGFPTEIALVAGDVPCGAQPMSRTRFAYAQATDPDGFWTSRKDWLTDSVHGIDTEVETIRDADPYGNLLSLTDPRGHATTVAYDGEPDCPSDPAASGLHTFPCVIRNAKGHAQAFLHDPGTGRLSARTDPGGHRTLVDHDDLGRVTSVRVLESGAPAALVLREYAYPALPGEPVPQEGTWGVTQGAGAQNLRRIDYALASASPLRDEGLEARDFLDGLGRPVLSRRDGDDRRPVDVETDYDGRDHLRRQFLPHFGDGDPSPGFTEFTYDALGRVTAVRHPKGNCTATAYDAFAEIVELREGCDPAATVVAHRESRRDAYGNVVDVREFPDPGDLSAFLRTNYSYDALDNLIEIRDACANDPAACDPSRPATQRHVTEFTYDSLSRKVRVADPALGSWDYLHDAVGNLVRQKDARPSPLYSEINFTYDEINRLVAKDYQDPGQRDLSFVYDEGLNGTGRLTGVTDEAGAVSYGYDGRGNLVHFIRDFTYKNKRFEFFYTYDNLGRPLDIEFPKDNSGVSIGRITHAYLDGLGRQTPFIQSVSGVTGGIPAGYLVEPGVSYDASGNLTGYVDGAGVAMLAGHDPQTSQITFRWAVGDTVWMAQQYEYDATTGYLESFSNVVDGAPGQSFPEYDGLGRLVRAIGPWGPDAAPAEAAYAYDAIDNLTLKDSVAAAPATAKSLLYEHPVNPHAVTRLHAGAAGTPQDFAYDANGNLIQKVTTNSVRTYGWDQDNRLVRVQQNGMGTRQFTYDYRGERVLSAWGSLKLFMPTGDFEW